MSNKLPIANAIASSFAAGLFFASAAMWGDWKPAVGCLFLLLSAGLSAAQISRKVAP